MTISKTLKNVTGGAELTRPEPTINYLIAATIGIVVLMGAWRMGDLIFARGSTFVQGRVTGVPATDFKAALGIV
jgi:hypothetical protein